ncbi:MAG: hypothetical protein Q9N34_09280 [Aquificota bacterium]|nr:hypothetical protein [Aquificota bacterium]
MKSWRPYRGLMDETPMGEDTVSRAYPDGCTMCGERLHLAINWKEKDRIFNEEVARHIKDSERLCGVCLVKRFAVKFCKEDLGLGEDRWHYPSTEEIAGIRFKEKLKEEIEKDPDLKERLLALSEKLKDTPYRVEVLPLNVNGELKDCLSFDSELFRKEAWEALFKEDESLKGLKEDIESLYNSAEGKENRTQKPLLCGPDIGRRQHRRVAREKERDQEG